MWLKDKNINLYIISERREFNLDLTQKLVFVTNTDLPIKSDIAGYFQKLSADLI